MNRDEDRRPTAIHEAAHAVGYHRTGIDMGTVTIIPNVEEGEAGSVQADERHWWNDDELEGTVVSLLAGAAAVVELLGQSWETARPGASSDFEKAENLVEKFLPNTTIDAWQEKACDFVRSEEAAIRYVADVLLAVKVLAMDEFDCVMDDLENGVPLEEAIQATRDYRQTIFKHDPQRII